MPWCVSLLKPHHQPTREGILPLSPGNSPLGEGVGRGSSPLRRSILCWPKPCSWERRRCQPRSPAGGRSLGSLAFLACTAIWAAPAQPALGAAAPASSPTQAAQAESALGKDFLAPPKMTLTAALDYALKNQPAVKAALARVSARQADVGIPRGKWLPAVGVTAQVLVGTANNTTASYLNEPLVPTPRIGGTPPSLAPVPVGVPRRPPSPGLA